MVSSYLFLQKKFQNIAPETVTCLIGGFFMLRLINPAIVSPHGKFTSSLHPFLPHFLPYLPLLLSCNHYKGCYASGVLKHISNLRDCSYDGIYRNIPVHQTNFIWANLLFIWANFSEWKVQFKILTFGEFGIVYFY